MEASDATDSFVRNHAGVSDQVRLRPGFVCLNSGYFHLTISPSAGTIADKRVASDSTCAPVSVSSGMFAHPLMVAAGPSRTSRPLRREGNTARMRKRPETPTGAGLALLNFRNSGAQEPEFRYGLLTRGFRQDRMLNRAVRRGEMRWRMPFRTGHLVVDPAVGDFQSIGE